MRYGEGKEREPYKEDVWKIMIYYDLSSVLKSVALSFLCGALISLLSMILDIVFDIFGGIVKLPKEVLSASRSLNDARSYMRSRELMIKSLGRAGEIAKDIVFMLSAGFSLSLLFYIAVDGELRLYILIVTAVTYNFVKKLLTVRIYKVLSRLISFIFKLPITLIIFVLVPIRSISVRVRASFLKLFGGVRQIKLEHKKR